MKNKKAEKKIEKNELIFTKQDFLNSKKYSEYYDLLNVILPEHYKGSSNDVDIKIKEYLKGEV